MTRSNLVFIQKKPADLHRPEAQTGQYRRGARRVRAAAPRRHRGWWNHALLVYRKNAREKSEKIFFSSRRTVGPGRVGGQGKLEVQVIIEMKRREYRSRAEARATRRIFAGGLHESHLRAGPACLDMLN